MHDERSLSFASRARVGDPKTPRPPAPIFFMETMPVGASTGASTPRRPEMSGLEYHEADGRSFDSCAGLRPGRLIRYPRLGILAAILKRIVEALQSP